MKQIATIERFETEVTEGELTVVHIRAYPSKKFTRGWWVNIKPTVFIKIVGSNEAFGLVYAFNVPTAPAKHYFKGLNDYLDFTLFFPALPKGVTCIDVIEDFSSSPHSFNFYCVPMSKIRNGVLKH